MNTQRDRTRLTPPVLPDVFRIENMPTAVYHLGISDIDNQKTFTLIPADPFPIIPKYYGGVESRTERMINTYRNINKSLGILLYGVSGSGKSMQARYLSCKAMSEEEMPTIIINDSSVGYIEHYIRSISRPCVFLFDEFEKMFFSSNDQDFLLSILDGTYSTKHIFILTANNPARISRYFFNRPSRIRYAFEYTGLDVDTIREVLDDNLLNKENKEVIVDLLRYSSNLSFDVLNSFIHECNLYPDEKPEELITGFNIISSTENLNDKYTFKITRDGVELSEYLTANGLKTSPFVYDLDVYQNGKRYTFNDIVDAMETKESKIIAYVRGFGDIKINSVENARFEGEDFIFDFEFNKDTIRWMSIDRSASRPMFGPDNDRKEENNHEHLLNGKFTIAYISKHKAKGKVKTLSDSY